MALMPWNPFREVDNTGREISSFFDFPSSFFGGYNSPGWMFTRRKKM
jgi:HSP20 family protein